MHNDNISDPRWESVEKDKLVSLSPAYPSYWKEVFRKFRGNRLSVLGVICIILMTVAAILGPFLSSHSYEKMELDFTNIPPLLDIYQIDEGTYLYMHPDYYFLQVTEDGEILERLKPVKNDMTARSRTFESGTHTIRQGRRKQNIIKYLRCFWTVRRSSLANGCGIRRIFWEQMAWAEIFWSGLWMEPGYR